MKSNLKLAALVVAVLAGSVALPAAAQSSASASVENLGFRLVDLNPDDGVTPQIVFGSGVSFGMTIISDLNGTLVQQSRTEGFGPAGFNTDYGGATAFTDATTARASLDVFSGAGYANAVNAFYFVLSANTRVEFTADALASSSYLASNGYSFAQALMTGSLKDSHGNVVIGANTDINANGRMYSAPLLLAMSSQDTALTGSLFLKVKANALSMAAPVPEPGSFAMMVAGVGLLAGVARRRCALARRA